MEDVRWKMSDGRCQMEDVRWKMSDGRCQMEDGRSRKSASRDLLHRGICGWRKGVFRSNLSTRSCWWLIWPGYHDRPSGTAIIAGDHRVKDYVFRFFQMNRSWGRNGCIDPDDGGHRANPPSLIPSRSRPLNGPASVSWVLKTLSSLLIICLLNLKNYKVIPEGIDIYLTRSFFLTSCVKVKSVFLLT